MTTRALVLPGDGVVARVGAGVVVLGGAADPAAALARLAEVLAGLEGTRYTTAVGEAGVGPVAAVAPGDRGWAVLVPEGMQVRTVYADRTSARDGPVHAVQHDVRRMLLAPPGVTPPAVEGLTPLADAPAPGAGVVLVAEEATGTPAPTEPVDVVAGVWCSCGALAPPTALRCVGCGEPLPADRQVARGPRPPLGALVAEDGTRYPLDRDYVLGRAPEEDPDVQSGRAVPLPLRDAQRGISRAHALVRRDGWDVLVADRGSDNGTFVRPADGWEWRRLDLGVWYRMLPGSDLRVGQRVLRFVPPTR